jgi:hypothetical protein
LNKVLPQFSTLLVVVRQDRHVTAMSHNKMC